MNRIVKIIALTIVGALVIFFPWLPFVKTSLVVNANLAGEYAIIAISLVLLTGWVGQISLGQGTFVGIGAFVTGLLIRNLHIPFPVNLPIVALVTAAVAAALGLVALRVRGLYLAVATLIFAWMADAYLFTSPWLVGRGGSSSIQNHIIGRPGTISSFDLTNKSVFYLVIVASVAATLYAISNLRDSKTGRAFFAIRGSEMAAVSLGIDVTRYKLLAFALSGGLAGIAGNLMMIDLRTASPVSFQFTVSLFFLSIAVVGGVTNIYGALFASMLFAGLNEVFYRVPALNGWLDIVAVGLLIFVLLVYPGGLGALGAPIASFSKKSSTRLVALYRKISGALDGDRKAAKPLEATSPAPRRLKARAQKADGPSKTRRGPRIALPKFFRSNAKVQRRSLDMSGLSRIEEPVAVPSAAATSEPKFVDWRTYKEPPYLLPPDRATRRPILQARGIVVRFGGLTAVDKMTVEVREHEIVGLIGPNGAGKTTCFNAISGLNEPADGTIELFGDDATHLPVHLRAQMGVGRTFQLIQLFPQLSVFDNLLVATHINNETGVFGHIALTDKAVRAEMLARRHVKQIVALLGLEEFADRRVAGLPFGVLRQVEIARALVTKAPFLMLDEPASGLDNTETEELTKLLYFIRAELGVSILLIEHDVQMVTSVSDYMYVINRGKPLAEGTSAEIQRNPEVVAAYLGGATHEEVIAEPQPVLG
ncbi:MAG: branched-chain amino acid ABC transporter ATP-binding protein/permease [Actinobacteria bacterium]|nr:branched-chain amino acid ABC transporter ATP-binding protein/permease [Actinomycetota bacterium]